MLVHAGRRERGTSEMVMLAGEAGLRLEAAHPAADLSIIELVVR